MTEDRVSSESPRVSSDDGTSSEDGSASEAAHAVESIASATNVLTPREFPKSGILLCRNWSGRTHPVQPCEQLDAGALPHSWYFHFTFHDYRVIIVEKLMDGIFEYSFAYDYWPNGRVKTVVWTRSHLGVLLEQFEVEG